MGNFASTSPAAKRLVETLQAKKDAKQNSMSASTGIAAQAPLGETPTEGVLPVKRKKSKGQPMAYPYNIGLMEFTILV